MFNLTSTMFVAIILVLVGLITLISLLATRRAAVPSATAPPGSDPNVVPALVLKLWDTGARRGEDPQVGLLLEVQPAGAPAYHVQTRCIISLLQLGQLQPGQTVRVLVDPLEPTRVTLALT